jgi:amino acid transporter
MLMLAKCFLVLFVIVSGCLSYPALSFATKPFAFGEYMGTIPLVLFSFMGFEGICSLSMHMNKGSNSAWKAVLISYGSIIGLYVAYQLLFYGFLSEHLGELSHYKDAFMILVQQVAAPFPHLWSQLARLLYCCIGLSALSGGYGILYANQWNLYKLAEQKTFLSSAFFAKINQHNMPIMCGLTQGIVCVAYLLISNSQQFLLQQLASTGCTITYFLSAYALYRSTGSKVHTAIGLLGMISCLLLLGACTNNFIINGISVLLIFVGIIGIGALLFITNRSKARHTNNN